MPSEHRLHPWSVLFLLGAQVRQFAVPVLLALFVGSRAGRDNWELYALPILVPYAGFVIIRYFTFQYAFGDGELVIRSGLIFRNERHIPYSRIQNLDAVQTALHRLLKVVDVRVDTGGAADTDAKLSVVSWEAYEEMRSRVLNERAVARRESGDAAGEAAAPVLALGTGDLALAGFIENRAAVLVAAVLGLLWESGLLEATISRLGIDVAGQGVLRRLVLAVFRDQSIPLEHVLTGVAAIAGLLVLLRIFSMIWAIVRLHGFRLTKVGPDLRTEYGLLTRVSATVPLHRIQTLTIRRGLIHRWTGRAAVKAETAGGGNPGADGDGRGASRSRESLAPIIRESELPAFLHSVLPDLDLSRIEWTPAANGAFGRELRARLVLALIGGLVAAVAVRRELAVGALLVFVLWAWVSARVYTRHLGWSVIDGGVLFRTGWIWRHLTVARFSKVQAVTMTQSPFDRRHRMASVRVDTAGAGGATHRVDIPYLPVSTAQDLHAQLALAAANTSFRW
jgi:putative membrane protein